mmetsp:Transcript_126445/g.404846  ORF Transcript_126445/g.404846 Transcript_126445/m.404846 type:complete len:390 (+) Transcript_126445:116-1285(+)
MLQRKEKLLRQSQLCPHLRHYGARPQPLPRCCRRLLGAARVRSELGLQCSDGTIGGVVAVAGGFAGGLASSVVFARSPAQQRHLNLQRDPKFLLRRSPSAPLVVQPLDDLRPALLVVQLPEFRDARIHGLPMVARRRRVASGAAETRAGSDALACERLHTGPEWEHGHQGDEGPGLALVLDNSEPPSDPQEEEELHLPCGFVRGVDALVGLLLVLVVADSIYGGHEARPHVVRGCLALLLRLRRRRLIREALPHLPSTRFLQLLEAWLGVLELRRPSIEAAGPLEHHLHTVVHRANDVLEPENAGLPGVASGGRLQLRQPPSGLLVDRPDEGQVPADDGGAYPALELQRRVHLMASRPRRRPPPRRAHGALRHRLRRVRRPEGALSPRA